MLCRGGGCAGEWGKGWASKVPKITCVCSALRQWQYNWVHHKKILEATTHSKGSWCWSRSNSSWCVQWPSATRFLLGRTFIIFPALQKSRNLGLAQNCPHDKYKKFVFSVKKMHWGFLIAAQEVKKWCLLPVCIWSCVLEQIWVVAIEFLAWSQIMPTSVSSYLKNVPWFFLSCKITKHPFCFSPPACFLQLPFSQILFCPTLSGPICSGSCFSRLLCHLNCRIVFSSVFMFLLPTC